MPLRVITTGGTIDKIYSLEVSALTIGPPAAGAIARQAGADVAVTEIARKDSLAMTDADRAAVRAAVEACVESAVVVTHGTDTMVQTARALEGITGKTIVLVGAMRPAAMADTDAPFNLGFAFAAAQLLSPGVYIAMNGRVFDPRRVRKNTAAARFENAD